MSLPEMSGIAVQLELDQPALPDDHIIFGPNSILGTFGEQSHTTFRASKGRISTFLTPPDPYIAMKKHEVVAAVVADLKRQGVDVEGRVKNFAVVPHPSEFYLIEPGSASERPSQASRWRATTPGSRSSAAWKAQSFPDVSRPKRRLK